MKLKEKIHMLWMVLESSIIFMILLEFRRIRQLLVILIQK